MPDLVGIIPAATHDLYQLIQSMIGLRAVRVVYGESRHDSRVNGRLTRFWNCSSGGGFNRTSCGGSLSNKPVELSDDQR